MAKVERKEVEPVFKPVTITLESQEEVDYVTALLGQGNLGIARAVGLNSTAGIYQSLLKYQQNKPIIIGGLKIAA